MEKDQLKYEGETEIQNYREQIESDLPQTQAFRTQIIGVLREFADGTITVEQYEQLRLLCKPTVDILDEIGRRTGSIIETGKIVDEVLDGIE